MSETIPCLLAPEALARAHGQPPVRARVRASPEDFRVEELLGFDPDGEGGHALVHVRKRGCNTEWVARAVARMAGVRPAQVGYSGLKDRHSVSSQWFSVDLQGRGEPRWSELEGEQVQVLGVHRHRRKLRRGSHRANRFVLVLREMQGDQQSLRQRLEAVAREGAPNYFGEQRFGREGANLTAAYAMLAGERVRDRHRRGLYLSAARALLFNRVLSARVGAGTWIRALPGEALMLDGSRSHFTAEAPDEDIARRVREGDLHPSGPLWGRGEPAPRGQARALEQAALAGCQAWCEGLEGAGLGQERRALRLRVSRLRWSVQGPDLRLEFELARGGYATAVLRELCLSA